MSVCEECGGEFTPYHKRQLFCSKQCCRKSTYRRKFPHRVDREIRCLTCGKAMVTRSGHKKFCSRQCGFVYRRKRAFEYKGGRCAICGYSRNYAALEFHHTDPSIKKHNPAKILNSKWTKVKAELDKCIMLCANCHRELHHPQHDR